MKKSWKMKSENKRKNRPWAWLPSMSDQELRQWRERLGTDGWWDSLPTLDGTKR